MPQVFPGSRRQTRRPLRRAGFTLVEILVVIGVIALLIGVLFPVVGRARESSNRVKCAANLRAIGQGLNAYADANKGDYPRTLHDPSTTPMVYTDAVPKPPTFVTTGRGFDDPFGNKGKVVGPNNVPAALFLLLRTQGLPNVSFICPSTDAVPDDFGAAGNTVNSKTVAIKRGNFTQLKNPTNLSYSYANPYPDAAMASKYRLGIGMSADFALAADLNPGKQGPYDVTLATETSSSKDFEKGNSSNHRGAGQNVLYADGHVTFQMTPFCGKGRDNIYTVSGSPTGDPPTSTTIVGSPTWEGDSVLLPAEGM